MRIDRIRRTSWKKRLLSYGAVAAACVMIGYAGAGALTASAESDAAATVATVVTSPFTDAVAEVRDSVVGINNYQMVRYSNSYGNWGNYFGWGYGNGNGNGRGQQEVQEQEVLSATGSGVVIGEGGYVLTNYHVVEDASKVTVAVGDQEYDAIVVSYDQNVDVAVLRADKLELPAVELGDSDTLRVGDWAICIGNPLSAEMFSGTVTVGVISGLDRNVSSTNTDRYGRKETTSNTMIQTDAAINSGNSGGGMFNTAGQLMGIPTLKYSGSVYSGASIDGIGMCIPINAAKPIIEDALKNGATVASSASSNADDAAGINMTGKPRMGITITSMNTNSQALLTGKLPNGVYVTEVDEGGPAAQAGIIAGDIIVDVDDTIITGVQQLQEILASHKEGDVLKVKVYRVEGITEIQTTDDIQDGEYVDVEITLSVVDSVKQ